MNKRFFVFLALMIFSLACKEEKDIEINNEIIGFLGFKDTAEELVVPSLVDLDGTEVVNNADVSPMLENRRELIEKRREEIVKGISVSNLKDMTCEEIIEKYKNVLKEFEKTKNIDILSWRKNNDVLFKACYEKHKIIFDSLERIENNLGNQFGF